MKLGFYLKPTKFQFALKYFKNKKIKILDIGCFNSVELTQRWFPSCHYDGVDISDKKISINEKSIMNRLFIVSEDAKTGYEKIPDNEYDFIILNHVLEHTLQQELMIEHISKKIKVGGIVWIAFPSHKSINFPSAKGTLNFYDDPTHVRITYVDEIREQLEHNNFTIIRAGTSIDVSRYLIGLFIYPFAQFFRIFRRKIIFRGLWYVYNFEDRIIGKRTK